MSESPGRRVVLDALDVPLAEIELPQEARGGLSMFVYPHRIPMHRLRLLVALAPTVPAPDADAVADWNDVTVTSAMVAAPDTDA